MITLPLLRELVERSRRLDRYVPFPGFPGIAEQFFDDRRTVDFFARTQAERFDLACLRGVSMEEPVMALAEEAMREAAAGLARG